MHNFEKWIYPYLENAITYANSKGHFWEYARFRTDFGPWISCNGVTLRNNSCGIGNALLKIDK
jgi:hypothetical protein